MVGLVTLAQEFGLQELSLELSQWKEQAREVGEAREGGAIGVMGEEVPSVQRQENVVQEEDLDRIEEILDDSEDDEVSFLTDTYIPPEAVQSFTPSRKIIPSRRKIEYDVVQQEDTDTEEEEENEPRLDSEPVEPMDNCLVDNFEVDEANMNASLTTADDQPLPCKLCGWEQPCVRRLVAHLATHHYWARLLVHSGQDSQGRACHMCGQEFERKSTTLNHVARVHNSLVLGYYRADIGKRKAAES